MEMVRKKDLDITQSVEPKYDFSDENLVNIPPPVLNNRLIKIYGYEEFMNELSAIYEDSYQNRITDRKSILTGPELEAVSINTENEIKKAKGMKKGGMPQQMELFSEGGLKDEGNTVDPVSGNDVPPGATQEEVRDDIPAQLSEGEFVFPADVVRYIGLEKLMMMRQEATAGLARMEEMGQMGNSEEATLPDDMPFEMADLDMRDETEEDVLKANVGAFVPPRFPTNQPYNPNVNPYMPTGNVTTPYMPYQPGQSQQILKPAGGGTGQVETEMRRYVNKETGQVRMIPFNKATGTSLYPIDALLNQGFIREDEAPKEVAKTAVPTTKVKPVEESGGDDGDNRIKEENVKNYGIENPTIMSLGGDIDPKSGKVVSTLNNPLMDFSINVKPDGFAGYSMPFNIVKSVIGLATGKSMVGDKDIITLTPKGHPTVKITFNGKEWKNILHDKTGKIKITRKEVQDKIIKKAQETIQAITSPEDVKKQAEEQDKRSADVTGSQEDIQRQKDYEQELIDSGGGDYTDYDTGDTGIPDAYDDPLMKQGGLASKKKPKVKRMKKGGLASKK